MVSKSGTSKFLGILFVSVACGILVALVTGLVENPPEASIIGAEYYGHPFVWRIVRSTIDSFVDYRFAELAVDVLFWIVISFIALAVVQRLSNRPDTTTTAEPKEKQTE